ncbi:hypothetical protein V8C44DRAFT_336417 [Trichoderma aethiopicum]
MPFQVYSVLWEPASCLLSRLTVAISHVLSNRISLLLCICVSLCLPFFAYFSIWPYVSDSPRFGTSPHCQKLSLLPLLQLLAPPLIPVLQQHHLLCFLVSLEFPSGWLPVIPLS